MPGIISGLISMFGWGTSDFLAAKSSRKFGFVLTLFWAQFIGFLLILFYFILNFHNFDIRGVIKFIPLIIIYSIFATISILAFFRALTIGEISLVSPITSSWAMITVILSVLFLSETLKSYQSIAIFLIIIGIILISIDVNQFFRKNRPFFSAGIKEAFIAMFGFGFAMFLLAILIKSVSWFMPAFLSRLFISIFLILYASSSKHTLIAKIQSGWILILIIASLDVIATFAYSFGVSSVLSSIVAPIAAASPLVTTILAQIFLKEKLALNKIFGIIMTILGLILISI